MNNESEVQSNHKAQKYIAEPDLRLCHYQDTNSPLVQIERRCTQVGPEEQREVILKQPYLRNAPTMRKNMNSQIKSIVHELNM